MRSEGVSSMDSDGYPGSLSMESEGQSGSGYAVPDTGRAVPQGHHGNGGHGNHTSPDPGGMLCIQTSSKSVAVKHHIWKMLGSESLVRQPSPYDSGINLHGPRHTGSKNFQAMERLVKRVLEGDRAKTSWSSFVLDNENCFRRAWNVFMIPILIYVGTVMPFRLAFLEFALTDIETGTVWNILETCLEFIFIIDLVLPFFFTYRDGFGHEVGSLSKIAKNYIRGPFIINLIACFPPELAEVVVGWTDTDRTQAEAGKPDNRLHKGVRFFRIQRVMRVVRLFRLVKVVSFMQESPRWRWFQSLRGVRVFKFVISLFWVIHLVACGWYLVASLHDNVEDTWPFRCFHEAILIANTSPFLSWLYSYYFALTVFTTVGFGDISPETSGETLYVCFVMMIGAIINGLVVSEIITIITSSSRLALDLEKQEKLVLEFSRQTQLREEAQGWLVKWLSTHHSVHHHEHDREKIMKLLIGNTFPREILGMLPKELYKGRLVLNRFITLIKHTRRKECPIQLPLFVGAAGHLRHYDRGEIVYYGSDLPSSVFLVIEGIFSHVGAIIHKGDTTERIKAASTNFDERHHQKHQSILYPYCLAGFGNYFGDEEIMLSRRHRRSCVRCETQIGGKLLVLLKNDWMSLAHEFPDMAHIWRSNAIRRERVRERFANSMADKHHADYQTLAAIIIQVWVREFIKRRSQPATPKSAAKRSLKRVDSTGKSRTVSAYAADVSMMRGIGEDYHQRVHDDWPLKDQQMSHDGQGLAQKVEHLSTEVADLKISIAEVLKGQRALMAAMYNKDPGSTTPAALDVPANSSDSVQQVSSQSRLPVRFYGSSEPLAL